VHRSEGRFRGHRVSCEQVPFLPAWAVAWVLDDPRKIPYLFVWKRPEDSSVREVVRVFAHSEPAREFPVNWTDWVEIKRPDGTRISFAPCCDLYHEMGARPGFSFVDIANFRAEGCTDGNWEDRESRDQPGGAGNAIACATRQRVGRSYITTAGPSPSV
jgi:hypothetical protein